jgi:anthranilate synthase component 1
MSQNERKLKLQKLQTPTNPLETFVAINSRNDYCYILESAEGPRKLAQYSFIGFSPSKILEARNGKYSEYSDNETMTITTDDPLIHLRRYVAQKYTNYTGLRFIGGLVGYFSYDTVRYLESLHNDAKDELKLPDFQFGAFDDGIVFDHLTGQSYYYWYEENRLREIEQLLSHKQQKCNFTARNLRGNISQPDFIKMVERAKRYIKTGDIFQVVLSKRFEFEVEGDLVNFYKALRQINPSPYMYFLKMEDTAIVGSSPEMLGRVTGKQVETFPIAGTRPVGRTQAENAHLVSSLMNDPKECAEHVMLVDLARNDVGRVCNFGSVRVPDFMNVQKYSHVHHIVSRVTGDLRNDRDAIDAFKGIFPAGTVSGAPKKRAMEIIDELEPCRRGPYAGAVGYFSYNGNADFAITIRTLVAIGKRAYVQAGAGIVADSRPRREWMETEHKAKALLRALKMGEG